MASVLEQKVAPWQSGTTSQTHTFASTPGAGDYVYVVFFRDNFTSVPTGVTGLGATWVEVFNAGGVFVWRGSGGNAAGNVVMTFSAVIGGVGAAWIVQGLASPDLVAIDFTSGTTTTLAGPVHPAGAGQVVMAIAAPFNAIVTWPANPAPATGWTAIVNGTYAGAAYRVPATSAMHQVSIGAGSGTNRVLQLVVGVNTSGPVTLIQDSFNRANSATVLGTPDVGGPYTVQTGTWGISGNEAYLVTGLTNAQVTFPAAFNLDISVKIGSAGLSSSVLPGLMFRWVDANNHWLLNRAATGFFGLYRCVAGTYTQVVNDFPTVVGDVVQAKAYGDQIAVYVNGKQYALVTDQFTTGSPSLAGLRSGGVSAPKWDDLLAQSLAALPTSWGSSPSGDSPAPLLFDSTSTFTPSLYKGRDTRVADESETP
jgi:hypothetical protein